MVKRIDGVLMLKMGKKKKEEVEEEEEENDLVKYCDRFKAIKQTIKDGHNRLSSEEE